METGKTLTEELKDVSRLGLSNKRYRSVKTKEQNFRKVLCNHSFKDVIILEYHYLKLEQAYKYQGGNILLQYAKLAGGILGYVQIF
jgi:hypothetical protein